MGNYSTLGLKGVSQYSWGLPEMQFARRCGADKQTYNGDLYIWHWSITAAKGLDRKTNTFKEQSAESPQLAYSWDESAKTPPSWPAPPPKQPQDHPVTFVNQSGMSLYLYYFIRVGGTVDCKDYANGGSMPPQSSKNFTIPAKQVGHFVFQKAQDPCPLSTILTTRDVRGGNGKPETIAIGP